MRKIIIESPFAGRGETEEEKNKDNLENIIYARKCVKDSVLKGEAPIASHLLFTQEGILRDGIEIERKLGIAAGLAWFDVSDSVAFYTDRGWSRGMIGALEFYVRKNVPRGKIQIRALEPNGRKIPEGIKPHLIGFLLDIMTLDK